MTEPEKPAASTPITYFYREPRKGEPPCYVMATEADIAAAGYTANAECARVLNDLQQAHLAELSDKWQELERLKATVLERDERLSEHIQANEALMAANKSLAEARRFAEGESYENKRLAEVIQRELDDAERVSDGSNPSGRAARIWKRRRSCCDDPIGKTTTRQCMTGGSATSNPRLAPAESDRIATKCKYCNRVDCESERYRDDARLLRMCRHAVQLERDFLANRVGRLEGTLKRAESAKVAEGSPAWEQYRDKKREAEQDLAGALHEVRHLEAQLRDLAAERDGLARTVEAWGDVMRSAARARDHVYAHFGTISPKVELGFGKDGPAVLAETFSEAAQKLANKKPNSAQPSPTSKQDSTPPPGVPDAPAYSGAEKPREDAGAPSVAPDNPGGGVGASISATLGKDHSYIGPDGAKWTARGGSLEDFKKAAAAQKPDPLHPDGRCSCGGEGRCDWCKAHCLGCGKAIANGVRCLPCARGAAAGQPAQKPAFELGEVPLAGRCCFEGYEVEDCGAPAVIDGLCEPHARVVHGSEIDRVVPGPETRKLVVQKQPHGDTFERWMRAAEVRFKEAQDRQLKLGSPQHVYQMEATLEHLLKAVRKLEPADPAPTAEVPVTPEPRRRLGQRDPFWALDSVREEQRQLRDYSPADSLLSCSITSLRDAVEYLLLRCPEAIATRDKRIVDELAKRREG